MDPKPEGLSERTGEVQPRGWLGSLVMRGVRNPVILIFVLAGIAEIFSGDPAFHAAALFAVAIALSSDALRRRVAGTREAEAARAPVILRLTPAIVIVGLVYAAVAGSFS